MAQSQQPQLVPGHGKGADTGQIPDLNVSWQSESVDLDVLFDSLGADASTKPLKFGDEGGVILGEGSVPMPVSLDDADLTALNSQVAADES